MGTKMGASRAHLPEALPTSRLTTAVSRMMPIMVMGPGRLMALSTSAPSTASSAPRLELPKAAVNWAQEKIITR